LINPAAWLIIKKLCGGIFLCIFAGDAGNDEDPRAAKNGMNRKVAAKNPIEPVISGDYVRRSDDGAHARRMKKQ
jgi:hypothetical protein